MAPPEFFVGYLALSPRLKRFLARLVLALACVVAGLAVAGALAHVAPGASAARTQRGLVGRLEARAYGVLWVREGDAMSPVLLARGGKFGISDALARLDGQTVAVDGLMLERDGYRLLELNRLDEHPSADAVARAALSEPQTRSLGRVRLRGEIVDIKCWLGRMKPGEGRTHRACAQFCISGGIPPVLVTRGPRGESVRHVLVRDDGGPANEDVLPYVAEAVELEGELSERGGITFLSVSPARMWRL